MMTRATVMGLLVALLVSAPVLAQAPVVGSPEPARRLVVPTRARDSGAAAVLRKRIDAVDWDNIPFQDVITWLKQQGPINVLVKKNALAVVGVDENTPVTLSLRDSTVANILTEVLANLGAGEGETDPIRFHVIKNVLKISTRSDFNRELIVKTYDVTDLILVVPSFRDAPKIDLQQQQGGGAQGNQNIFSGGGGGGGDEDNQGQGQRGNQQVMVEVQDLIDAIKATIEPDTWEIAGNALYGGAAGGGKGTIVPYKRSLVIRNTIEVHEQLGGTIE